MRRVGGKAAIVLGALAVLVAFGVWAFGPAETVVSQAPSSSVATENTVGALGAGIDEAQTRGVFDTTTANALIVFGGLPKNTQPDASSVKTAINAEHSGGRLTESEGALLLFFVATRIGSSSGETAAAVETRLRAAVQAPALDVKPTGLTVDRPGGGATATLTWTPGADAAQQYVVAFKQSADVDVILGSLKFEVVAGDAVTETLEDLETGVYVFKVVGEDSNGNIEDSAGNLYEATMTQ